MKLWADGPRGSNLESNPSAFERDLGELSKFDMNRELSLQEHIENGLANTGF